MNLPAIYHKTLDNYCYQFDNNSIIINLITGYDVDKVFIRIGDPFAFTNINGKRIWVHKKYAIESSYTLKFNKIWSIKISPPYRRCCYFFEIYCGNENILLLDNGIFYKEEIIKYNYELQKFSFGFLNSIDVNFPPKWVNNTIWYEIFIDGFCNSIESKNNISKNQLFGGDINGIITKLDYIYSLGINGIYLTPINKSNSIHKYDTIDYFEIDESLGDKLIVKKLINEAHKRNIKVMFDAVFNHCSSECELWKDVKSKGFNSKYINWFMVNEWPFNDNHRNSVTKKFYTYAFLDDMPKLNTNNQEVIDYLLDICEYWINEYDIDAIRLDASDELSHKCIQQIRNRTKQIKNDFFILGENWHNSIAWLRGNQLDSVTNYPMQKSILDFWINQTISADEFSYMINSYYSRYMEQTNEVLFNIVDSHDTQRLITSLKSVDKFYQVVTFLFTMTGSPCIYYGTEILLEGINPDESRKYMPWNMIEKGQYADSISIIQLIIKLRKKYCSLKSGKIIFLPYPNNKRIVSYKKFSKESEEEIEIILNCSNEAIKVKDISKNILFSRLYEEDILNSNGIIIMK